MNISKKIEQIRLQPEHVRLRYVWGSVAVSMLVIISIWIFSIGSLFQGKKSPIDSQATTSSDITKQLEDLKQQAPSLKDFSTQSLNLENEGVATDTKQAESEFEYPTETATGTTTEEIPQASAYSDLVETLPAQ